MHNFRFDPTRHDDGDEDGLRARRGAFDWQDAVALCVHHPKHAVVLRREALELLHPDRAAGAATVRRSSSRSTCEWLRDPPGARGDPPHPDLHTGPAHGEAACRLHRRAAARARARRSTTSPGSGSPRTPASGSSTRRTCRAGTTRAGSTRAPSAAASTSYRGRSPAGCSIGDAVRRLRRYRDDPSRPSARRAAVGAQPDT